MDNESQIKFIKSILPLVFQGEESNFVINVYLKSDDIPLYLEIDLGLEFEFLIVLQINYNSTLLDSKISTLSRLLSKQIIKKEDKTNAYLLWFEGLQSELQIEEKKELLSTNENHLIDRIKSETRLPNWLDKCIFDNLHAKYEPNYEKFDYNLEHSNEELLIYLGTYFPRSFAEAFCIYEDLFSNKVVNHNIKSKGEVNILDIGCGTGGNLLGLLTAINKHFTSNLIINVWAIDGNLDALKIFENIIHQFDHNYSIIINYTLINETFNDINDISVALQTITCRSFDFIMSFKTIVEIVSRGKGLNNNSYLEWFNIVCELLNPSGLVLIADVTTKTKYSDYLPLLLNEQARAFIKNNPLFKILSPLSCSTYSNICNNNCFYKHEFYVSHRQKNRDVSRIIYKIIGRSAFVEKIIEDKKRGKFVINWKQYNNRSSNRGYCINSMGENSCIDAYKIS
jgi:SAM-dependent methyltransferase